MSEKFRAWHKIEKKMVYFTLNHLLINYCDEFNYCGISDTDLFRYHQDIENLEIMQYIGRKDCKGNEIYKGDILRVEGIGAYTVSCGIACFVLIGHSDRVAFEDVSHRYLYVVGNIYENPELLT